MENLDYNKHEKKKRQVRRSFGYLANTLKDFIIETISIREGTDVGSTISSIKKDMLFRGQTVWILIASIFIASIGLNTSSIPVVIGAMLISPLMGPILAIGLSVGTYDSQTLIRALKNFGVAIAISLLTSTIYFIISPLKEPSPELIARTNPTILDVLIAIFGGLAGIVAGSRREKSNVIPGVAIATALMPPLCTAGYGIATHQLNFFLGAIYLFFINSVFISLSTYFVVKYLRFPNVSLLNPKREKKIKMYIYIFVVLTILPSAKIFIDVLKESRFNTLAKQYAKENLKFENSEIINKKITYNDTLSRIDVYLIGEVITPNQIEYLNELMPKYGLINNSKGLARWFSVTDSTVLKLHQENDNSDTIFSQLSYLEKNLSREVRIGIIEDIYKKNEEIIFSKNQRIKFLEGQIIELKKDTIPIHNITKEVKIYFPKIKEFAYGKTIGAGDSNKTDTMFSFIVKWQKRTWRKEKKKQKEVLKKWLKVRLNLDTLRVVEDI